MIKSAVTANHSKSLSMVPFFIPLVANDRVFLTNLITVLVDRTSTSNTNGLSDTQRMARAALDQSKIKDPMHSFFIINISVNAEVDPAALLSIYASRISDSAMGRQLVSDYQIALSYALRDRNPKYVVR